MVKNANRMAKKSKRFENSEPGGDNIFLDLGGA